MEDVVIRRLKKEDAEEIGRINAVITKRPLEDDFKKTVTELAPKLG